MPEPKTTGTNVLVALDGSVVARAALDFAAKQLLLLPRVAGAGAGSEEVQPGNLTVVVVIPPIVDDGLIDSEVSSAVEHAVCENTLEEAKQKVEEDAELLLQSARARLVELGVPEPSISTVKIHASNNSVIGSSGVGPALAGLVDQAGPDVLVMGSRGLGGFKAGVLNLLGMGSASDYCLHHCKCPVLVWHGDANSYRQQTLQPRRKVLIAMDDSEAGRHVLAWALQCAVASTDELHLVSVAHAAAAPVVVGGDSALAATCVETARVTEESRLMMDGAADVCRRSIALARSRGFPASQLYYKALAPEGPGTVADSLTHYATKNGMQIVVVGSRSLSAWQRAIGAIMGSGSVSDYIVHSVNVPVLVVRQ